MDKTGDVPYEAVNALQVRLPATATERIPH